ncbi:DUF6265 family protein [Arsenicibacter rosenii]|uniref:DUF6265 domain-containing protein n=1 Tax=Arsenicibacter rosenii TaxID=1750698 RepID=A0A1S2VP30_9BACT|nr:DUF6265 family protein [Arsenicibacter rosenii]OIN60542.1 hypothetical protein BLX24_06245 [Arsenicibacter rosenii]
MNRFFLILGLVFASLTASRAQPSGHISDLAFIEGHWQGTHNGGPIEAVWSAPTGDNMIGFIRMMKDSKITLYELFGIEQTEQGPVVRVRHFKPGLIAQEDKDKPDHYTFVEASKGRAVFEKTGDALRVLYEKRAADQFVIALGRQQDGKWVFKDLFTFNRVK